MLAAYKLHIYPKAWQERLLKSCLAMPCILYNALRDMKIDTWRQRHVSLGEDDLRQIVLEKLDKTRPPSHT